MVSLPAVTSGGGEGRAGQTDTPNAAARSPRVHMSAKLTTLVDVALSAVCKGEYDGLGGELYGSDSGLRGRFPVGGNDGGERDSKMTMADGARRNLFEDQITYLGT